MSRSSARPCVLFDLDDTLLDHSFTAKRAALELYAHYRADFAQDEASFWARWHIVTEAAMAAFSRGEMSVEQQRRVRMREMFKAPQMSDAEADERYAVYPQAYFRHLRVFEDARPCLAALAGFRLALITNGGAETQRRKLAHSELGPHFEFMLTPSAEMPGKPARGLFDEAVRRLDVVASQCVYVGDKLDTDARSATDAGMHGVWLDRGDATGSCELPRVTNLAAFVELVAGR